MVRSERSNFLVLANEASLVSWLPSASGCSDLTSRLSSENLLHRLRLLASDFRDRAGMLDGLIRFLTSVDVATGPSTTHTALILMLYSTCLPTRRC